MIELGKLREKSEAGGRKNGSTRRRKKEEKEEMGETEDKYRINFQKRSGEKRMPVIKLQMLTILNASEGNDDK